MDRFNSPIPGRDTDLAKRAVVLVHWLSCDRAQNNFRRLSGHDDRPNSFSSVTFVILFFFHSHYPFFCIALGALCLVQQCEDFVNPDQIYSLFTFTFFVLVCRLNNQKEITRLILILKQRRILLD